MPSKPSAPGSAGNGHGHGSGGGGGENTPLLAARRGLIRSATGGRFGHCSPSLGKPSRSATVLLYSVGVSARGAVWCVSAASGDAAAADCAKPAAQKSSRIVLRSSFMADGVGRGPRSETNL